VGDRAGRVGKVFREGELIMGLDISVSMVCGVKASDLFPSGLRECSRSVQTFDALGRPTGRTVQLKEIYLDSPTESFLVGTNEGALSKPYGSDQVSLRFSSLFTNFEAEDENATDERWVHVSSCESQGLSQVIIGLLIPEDSQNEPDNKFNYQVPAKTPDDLVFQVRQELRSRFGYEGMVHAIAVVYYSY
jgi:hypothetical protein